MPTTPEAIYNTPSPCNFVGPMPSSDPFDEEALITALTLMGGWEIDYGINIEEYPTGADVCEVLLRPGDRLLIQPDIVGAELILRRGEVFLSNGDFSVTRIGTPRAGLAYCAALYDSRVAS